MEFSRSEWVGSLPFSTRSSGSSLTRQPSPIGKFYQLSRKGSFQAQGEHHFCLQCRTSRELAAGVCVHNSWAFPNRHLSVHLRAYWSGLPLSFSTSQLRTELCFCFCQADTEPTSVVHWELASPLVQRHLSDVYQLLLLWFLVHSKSTACGAGRLKIVSSVLRKWKQEIYF